MADPVTTVVTVISEHPEAAAAVASFYGVAKPFLAKILGPSAEEIGEIGRDYIKGRRAKNAKRTLLDADKMLAETGREPQEVPLNIAVPLLESASLQEEPNLAAKWSALLANAADPAQRVAVLPSFNAVLNDLPTDDAEVLSFIYDWGKPEGDSSFGQSSRLVYSVVYKHFDWRKERVEVSIDNLLRLRLCAELLGGFDSFSSPDPDGLVALTRFGVQFLQAVTPPKP